MTCTQGTWTNSPTGYAYQWYQAVTSGGVPLTDGNGNYLGVAISGATNSSYTPVNADIDQLLFCDVTATNASGSTIKSSNYTNAVQGTAAAQQFLVRATLTTSNKIRYANLIDNINATSGLWAKIGVLKRYDAPDAATSLINLKSSSYPTDNSDGLPFTAGSGYAAGGSTSTSLDEPWPTEYAQNSASYFVWTTNGANNALLLARGGSTAVDAVYPRFTDGRMYLNLNSSADDPTGVVVSASAGMYGGSRTNNTLTYYQNGVNKGSRTDTSHATSGTTLQTQYGLYPGTTYAAVVSSALSDADVTALYNAMASF